MFQIRLTITSDLVGLANPAQVTFGFDPDKAGIARTASDNLAACIAFIGTSGVMAGGIRIQSAAMLTPAAGDGAVQIPWPDEELGVYAAVHGDNFGTSYGAVPVGIAGGLAAIGTSVLVTESTSVGGRRNGRLYLPWAGQGALSANGLVAAEAQTQCAASYNCFLRGIASSGPFVDFSEVVEDHEPYVIGGSASAPTSLAVTSVRVSPTPATLRSRKR